MAAGTAPNPSQQEVGRIPQTTVGVPGGGPFIRYANNPGMLPAYTSTGNAFGARVNLPLTSVSGFLRRYRLTITANAGATTGAGFTADGPWNTLQTLTFNDSGGQPIYQPYDGFSLFALQLYSGQCGNGGSQDPRIMPSYSTVSATTGAYQYKIELPFAINSSDYCALPSDNSAELPKMSVLFAATAATVLSGTITTAPTLNIVAEADFAPVPNNYPGLSPFDDGASAQWWINNSSQQPPSAAAARIQDQSVGQFVHSKIYVFRDGNNARQDVYPSTDFSYYIDNYPYVSSARNDDIYDIMAKAYGVGNTVFQTRPTGVIALPFWRQSVRREVDDSDDLERILVTTGSTKLEVGGTWGTFTGVGQLQALTGMVFPGATGWPYGSQAAVVASGQAA